MNCRECHISVSNVSTGRRTARLAALVMMVVTITALPARADVVAARGKPPLVTTQVLRLHEGRLMCRGEGGEELGFPIEQVDYLQVTGWQMFNLAEKQRRAQDWRRAAVSYERALADLQLEQHDAAAPADALDRPLLVRCRLIAAWDAQARFDRAVELYLEVIAKIPALADALRPANFPETGSTVLEMAEKQVDAAILQYGDDDLGLSLRKWRAAWPARPTPPASQPHEMSAALQVDNHLKGQIKEVAELVQAGRCDEALVRIHQLRREAHGKLQADLYYWQGRALEARLVASPATASARAATQLEASAELARAGITYMRVVVHFPHHPLAAEALYRAAEVCRLSGQREQAETLLSELIAVYPRARSADGSVLADKAREELKR